MKKIFITLLISLPFISFSQNQKGSFFKPKFSDFSYYTPNKDTLFLQKNNINSEIIKTLWNIDTFNQEKKPIFHMVNSIPDLKLKREKIDW